MILYLDTSALVKLYVSEPESDLVRQEVAGAAIVATSRVAYPEARAAFARCAREKTLASEDLRQIVAALDLDWESYFVVEVTEGIARHAGQLAQDLGLRGFDGLHVASAAALQRRSDLHCRFLCFDQRLLTASATLLNP